MYSCLLKKLVPFALTFVFGATIGGLFKSRVTTWSSTERTTLMLDHGGYGYGHSCRMYRRDLVAETKPLVILFKPDARVPSDLPEIRKKSLNSLWVHVTFGADGKIQNVESAGGWLSALDMRSMGSNGETELKLISNAVDRAARQIQFTPETVNSVPITVTKDVEIRFMPE